MGERPASAPRDAKALRWGEDNPVDAAPSLSEDERQVLRDRTVAMDKLLADQGKAKWKIEIMFFHKRRLSSHSAGAISIWESGARLHGGGDTKAYFCPARELKVSNCDAIIPDSSNGYGFLACPSCQKVWKADEVYGEIFGRWPTRIWAEKILHFFVKLGHNADIYLKYPRDDLRVAARAEQEKQHMGVKLERVRQRRVQYIYPLKHILQDTANGADLLGRFQAFLTS